MLAACSEVRCMNRQLVRSRRVHSVGLADGFHRRGAGVGARSNDICILHKGTGRQPPYQDNINQRAPFRSGVQIQIFKASPLSFPNPFPTTSFVNHEVLYPHCLNCLVGLQCIRTIHHQLPVSHNFPSASKPLIVPFLFHSQCCRLPAQLN